jgi:hypothetical protein
VIFWLLATIAVAIIYSYKNRNLVKYIKKILYFDFRGYDPSFHDPSNYFLGNDAQAAHLFELATSDECRGDNNQANVLQLRENVNSERNELHLQSLGSKTINTEQTKIKSKSNQISIPDYESLTPMDLLIYDKRSNFKYLTDILILEHPIISVILKRSLKDPLFLRLFKLLFSLSIVFGMNALTYTDSYIDMTQSNVDNVNC